MSRSKPVTIARANLVRLLRDRLGLFFIVVLPLIIILVTGLQFGGGFEARVGVAAVDGGALGDELIATLERDYQVERYTDVEILATDVTDGAIAFGVALPDRYTKRLIAGESLEVTYHAAPNDSTVGTRTVVAAALGEQSALTRAATFAAAETESTIEAVLPAVESAADALPPIEVTVVTVGESLFPPELAGFTLGAQGQLVLFIFLTSLTGSAQLIVSRQLGVSRRMLSTPTPMPAILLGEALGRFGVAMFQGLFIVAATAIFFGVAWGDPLGVSAIVIAFCLLSAGVAMLIGAVASNAEQASSIGVFAGLGIAALGGSMIPPEIFPPVMETISWFIPHRWAIDGLRELVAGGTLLDVIPQVGLLLAAAAVVLVLATWRLRVALTT